MPVGGCQSDLGCNATAGLFCDTVNTVSQTAVWACNKSSGIDRSTLYGACADFCLQPEQQKFVANKNQVG